MSTPTHVATSRQLAAAASACAACGLALQPAERLSLIVDITERRDDGIEY